MERRLEECPGSRDIYDQLGDCLYHIDDWTEEDKLRIERSFQRSLSLDAGSCFSLMFLGFFYFHVSEYKLSICCAEALFQHPRKECIPNWRLLRLHGIMITCHALLEAIDIAELRNILERLLEAYARSEDEDVEEAQPTELVSALKKSVFAKSWRFPT